MIRFSLRKILSLILSFVMVVSMFVGMTFRVSAADISGSNGDGTITWTSQANDTGYTVTVSGTGEITANLISTTETVTELIISEGITSIAASAFSNLADLKVVDLPLGLTSVENGAFPTGIVVKGYLNDASGRYTEEESNGATLKIKKIRILSMGNSHTVDYTTWLKKIKSDIEAGGLETDIAVTRFTPMGGRKLFTNNSDKKSHYYCAQTSTEGTYSQYQEQFAKTWDLVIVQDWHESCLSDENGGGAYFANAADESALDMAVFLDWIRTEVPGAEIGWFADWADYSVSSGTFAQKYAQSVAAMQAVAALENAPEVIINASTCMQNARTSYFGSTKNFADVLTASFTDADVNSMNSRTILERDATHVSLELGRYLMGEYVMYYIYNHYKDMMLADDNFDFLASLKTEPVYDELGGEWRGEFTDSIWNIVKESSKNAYQTPLAETQSEYTVDPFCDENSVHYKETMKTALEAVIANTAVPETIDYTTLYLKYKSDEFIASLNNSIAAKNITAVDVNIYAYDLGNDQMRFMMRLDYHYGYTYDYFYFFDETVTVKQTKLSQSYSVQENSNLSVSSNKKVFTVTSVGTGFSDLTTNPRGYMNETGTQRVVYGQRNFGSSKKTVLASDLFDLSGNFKFTTTVAGRTFSANTIDAEAIINIGGVEVYINNRTFAYTVTNNGTEITSGKISPAVNNDLSFAKFYLSPSHLNSEYGVPDICTYDGVEYTNPFYVGMYGETVVYEYTDGHLIISLVDPCGNYDTIYIDCGEIAKDQFESTSVNIKLSEKYGIAMMFGAQLDIEPNFVNTTITDSYPLDINGNWTTTTNNGKIVIQEVSEDDVHINAYPSATDCTEYSEVVKISGKDLSKGYNFTGSFLTWNSNNLDSANNRKTAFKVDFGGYYVEAVAADNNFSTANVSVYNKDSDTALVTTKVSVAGNTRIELDNFNYILDEDRFASEGSIGRVIKLNISVNIDGLLSITANGGLGASPTVVCSGLEVDKAGDEISVLYMKKHTTIEMSSIKLDVVKHTIGEIQTLMEEYTDNTAGTVANYDKAQQLMSIYDTVELEDVKEFLETGKNGVSAYLEKWKKVVVSVKAFDKNNRTYDYVRMLENGSSFAISSLLKDATIKGVVTAVDGYEFNGSWTVDGNDVDGTYSITDSIMVTPNYTKSEVLYSLTVEGANGTQTQDIAYNTRVTTTEEQAGEGFTHWQEGGKPVSFEKEYSFFIGYDRTIVSVSDAADLTPIIMLNKIVRGTDGYTTLYSERTMPSDCVFVSAGIIMCKDYTVSEDDLTLENVDGEVIKKGITKSTSLNGQYAVVTPDSEFVMAKAFLVYKDSEGVEHTIYSDINKRGVQGEGIDYDWIV